MLQQYTPSSPPPQKSDRRLEQSFRFLNRPLLRQRGFITEIGSPDVYIEPSRTSTMELYCGNS